MAKKQLGFQATPALAIAEGAATPDPGIVGISVWSSTLGKPVYWTGVLWTAGAPLAQPPLSTLANNLVATTETIVARWALPAGYLSARQILDLAFMGQVSSTATLTFRVRIGTAGTTADALAGTFATSAAGAANAHVTGDIKVAVLTATTATASGQVQLANATLGLLTAAFAAAIIAPASALFVSLTLVQSVAQTYTSREAVLTRLN